LLRRPRSASATFRNTKNGAPRSTVSRAWGIRARSLPAGALSSRRRGEELCVLNDAVGRSPHRGSRLTDIPLRPQFYRYKLRGLGYNNPIRTSYGGPSSFQSQASRLQNSNRNKNADPTRTCGERSRTFIAPLALSKEGREGGPRPKGQLYPP